VHEEVKHNGHTPIAATRSNHSSSS